MLSKQKKSYHKVRSAIKLQPTILIENVKLTIQVIAKKKKLTNNKLV